MQKDFSYSEMCCFTGWKVKDLCKKFQKLHNIRCSVELKQGSAVKKKQENKMTLLNAGSF